VKGRPVTEADAGTVMLDTRNYDRSITTLNWNDDYVAELVDDAGRSLMGSAQENWFYRSLSESKNRGATWRVIGNQIIFSRMNNSAVYGDALNADQWDGYTVWSHNTKNGTCTNRTKANRNRTLNHLYSHNISNTAFLAGDSHANWVSDLVWLDETPYDQTTGAGAIGVEFAGTAVSSTGGRKLHVQSACCLSKSPELRCLTGGTSAVAALKAAWGTSPCKETLLTIDSISSSYCSPMLPLLVSPYKHRSWPKYSDVYIEDLR
jgi:phosphodiesterase/alkaline phosphatase D-like protein